MSLYRTYRPQTFAEVIGQDHIVSTLEQALAQGKMAHAYLFAGARGTGKTSVARILAKTLLTQSIEDENVKKQIIKAVEEGSLVDLVEIDAASNRGIDDVRDLIEKIQFSPVAAGAKVYIIDEAHMLTREAFNALLKTLEEPPAYAYFILATTELQKIPPTIQSRCQRFAFRQIREEDIVRGLQKIVDSERITIDRPALRAIAGAAQGGLRDAISLLDQLRSLPKVTVEEVRERTGESGTEEVSNLFAALDASDANAVLDVIRRVESSGMAMDVFARQLLGRVRTDLHATIGEGTSAAMHQERMESLLNAIRDLRLSPVPALVLEAVLVRLCTGQTIVAPVQRKIETPVARPPIEKASSTPPPAPVTAAKETPPPPAPSALVEAPSLTLESIQQQWSSILKEVKPAYVKMSLKNGRVVGLTDLRVRIAFSSSYHRDKVTTTDASRGVEEVLAKIFHAPLRIECVLEGAGEGASTREEVVNLAEAASELF